VWTRDSTYAGLWAKGTERAIVEGKPLSREVLDQAAGLGVEAGAAGAAGVGAAAAAAKGVMKAGVVGGVAGIKKTAVAPKTDKAADSKVEAPQGVKTAAQPSMQVVPFDGKLATEKMLGTSTTPKGRQINFHAADRMVNPPAGRAAMSPADVDKVLDGATKVVKRNFHPNGNTVTLENANMPGKPRVVVDEATGKRVITVINPKGK
jgi:hypothetical protein